MGYAEKRGDYWRGRYKLTAASVGCLTPSWTNRQPQPGTDPLTERTRAGRAGKVTGSLVPPRDVAALTEALRQAIVEPRRRMRYVTAGLGRIRESYDCEPLRDPLPRTGPSGPRGGPGASPRSSRCATTTRHCTDRKPRPAPNGIWPSCTHMAKSSGCVSRWPR